jgi:hypothetical protein
MSKNYFKNLLAAVTLTLMLGGTVKATTTTLASLDSTTLATAMSNATSGDTLLLPSGTLPYYNSTNFGVTNKILTLKAASGASPIIRGYFKINTSTITTHAGLSFIGIELSLSSLNYAVQFSDSASIIKFKDCKIHGASRSAIYSNNQSVVDSVIFDNCIIYNMGGGDSYPLIAAMGTNTTMGVVKVVNSTIYNIKAPLLKFNDSKQYTAQKAIFNHCTIDSVNTGSVLFLIAKNTYITSGDSLIVKNCIFSHIGVTSSLYRKIVWGQALSNISYSRFYQVTTATDVDTSVFVTINSGSVSKANPTYADSVNKDFTVNNSAFLNAASDGLIIGDPRWTPTITKVTSVADAGINVFPNPVVDVLNIASDKQSVVDIYNVLGAKISTNTVDANGELSVSGLKSGVYVVKVQSGGETKTVQIIKK